MGNDSSNSPDEETDDDEVTDGEGDALVLTNGDKLGDAPDEAV